MGFKFLGGVAHFRVRPPGAPFPHLTLGDFGPMGPDKSSFCLGGSPSIWGRYEFWPVCILDHFFSSQILDFFANRKSVRPAIDPENLNEIATTRFEQISFEVRKKRDISLFPKAKIF